MPRKSRNTQAATPAVQVPADLPPELQPAPAAPLDAEALAALGKFGLGTDEATAACPHCGINHMDNGYMTPDDMGANELQDRSLHQLGLQHAEHACMGCGGEWGPVRPPYAAPTSTAPTGKGLKIQKDRIERNGIKQPSAGGACRAVWDACDLFTATHGKQPTSKDLAELVAAHGWNKNNASIEFYRWRKWAA